MHSEYDVIIIGGGAAGIGAARRLAANGKAALLLEASSRLGGRAFTQDLGGYPLDLGCEWLHSGDRNAWVGIGEVSGFPVDRSDPPWAKAHRGIAWDEDDEEAARKAFGDWEERLRVVAQGSDRASDALEPRGEWNAYVRAIAGFMCGMGPEKISATDYLAYDDASTGRNWNLPLGYGSLVTASLPSSTALRLATPAKRIDLTADGVAVTTRAGTVRAGAAILTFSTAVLAGDAIRLLSGTEPSREAAAAPPTLPESPRAPPADASVEEVLVNQAAALARAVAETDPALMQAARDAARVLAVDEAIRAAEADLARSRTLTRWGYGVEPTAPDERAHVALLRAAQCSGGAARRGSGPT